MGEADGGVLGGFQKWVWWSLNGAQIVCCRWVVTNGSTARRLSAAVGSAGDDLGDELVNNLEEPRDQRSVTGVSPRGRGFQTPAANGCETRPCGLTSRAGRE